VQTATIGAALEQGFIRFGPAFRQALLGPDGQPAEGVIVLVDGRNVRFAEGLETPLGPDDEAAIFPPSAGG
jgi:molybdopterin synthase sulfur carrier subunit